MKITVLGGGPAGLWFARTVKRADPSHVVTVYEQNPPDATYGFGVVFSTRALDMLRREDPGALDEMASAMEIWDGQTIVHRDETVAIDGGGYAGIERMRLLAILQELCRRSGVTIAFESRIGDLAAFDDADLVVGADGANSVVRAHFAAELGTRQRSLTNHFAWFGVDVPYETHTLTFRRCGNGTFVAHHYRYKPQKSTFLVECDEQTWHDAGLDAMDDAARKRFVEEVFASELHGRPLIENKSNWRNFPVITNDRWSTGRYVLIGDALRTAHFSIGSGTRLAIEDASALASAIAASTSAGDAVALYETNRRPAVERFAAAAARSFSWYEQLRSKMELAPIDLVYDYLVRTGRVDDERLRRETPAFMQRYERALSIRT